MNPIDFPICLQTPDYMSTSESWHGHMPFGLALIDIIRPSRVVELGVYYGDSFFTWCQAIRFLLLNTSCTVTGIDTFQGDESMGEYDGDGARTIVVSRAQSFYPDFTTIIHNTFDASIDRFANESIDLLHHDGCHNYDAVKHDFESWLPKLSHKGIWIMHDTEPSHLETGQVIDGASIFWRELVERFPHQTFSFPHAHGLGLLYPHDPPSTTIEILTHMQHDQAARVQHFFALLGSRVSAAYTMRKMLYKRTDLA